jgi:hypothetical protein
MSWPVAAEGNLIIHQHAQQLRHQAAEQADGQTQASIQQTAQPGGISFTAAEVVLHHRHNCCLDAFQS